MPNLAFPRSLCYTHIHKGGETVLTVIDKPALPSRRREAHKGDFGRVLIIAGSVGYTGAPSFASRAAVRSGAGLVFLGVPQEIYGIEAVKNDEAMVFPLPGESGRLSAGALSEILARLGRCDSCLIGPGLGLGDTLYNIVYSVIEACRVPLIIDADGITAVSKRIELLSGAKCPIALTPHEGEFLRLGGDLSKGREYAARSFAEEHGVTLVLKGSGTVVAFPDGSAFINPTGNPGMAKGGSGDVLAGMAAALVPQLGFSEGIKAAVYYHGLAGDIAAEKYGQYAMTPSDTIACLGEVLR